MEALLAGNLRTEGSASRICLSRSCIKFNPSQAVSLSSIVFRGNRAAFSHRSSQHPSYMEPKRNKDNAKINPHFPFRTPVFPGFLFTEVSVVVNVFHTPPHPPSPAVCLEKLCHLGLQVQFAKRLMALYDSTI